MNMITGYSGLTKGQIIVNGYDVEKNPNQVKRQIGYMIENAPLYEDLTVKEYIDFIAELKKVSNRKEKVKKIIKDIKLEDVQNKLIRNLSKGYKQRVSIAGTLVDTPKIIILDEPTVGLDPTQVIEIREIIKDLKKAHTVILSSHILSEVSQVCDKVIIMHEGQILTIDTPKNLEKLSGNVGNYKIIVEDEKDNIMKMKDKIKDIEKIEFITKNADETKEYKIKVKEDKDVRKNILLEFPKNDIMILELKQEEANLEKAFIKIIEKNKGGKK